MVVQKTIYLMLGLAIFSGCHSFGFHAKRQSELNCPTDIRQTVPWCAGEDAIFRCPCGPASGFHGYKPTCWGVWATSGAEWRDIHCGPLQQDCLSCQSEGVGCCETIKPVQLPFVSQSMEAVDGGQPMLIEVEREVERTGDSETESSDLNDPALKTIEGLPRPYIPVSQENSPPASEETMADFPPIQLSNTRSDEVPTELTNFANVFLVADSALLKADKAKVTTLRIASPEPQAKPRNELRHTVSLVEHQSLTPEPSILVIKEKIVAADSKQESSSTRKQKKMTAKRTGEQWFRPTRAPSVPFVR